MLTDKHTLHHVSSPPGKTHKHRQLPTSASIPQQMHHNIAYHFSGWGLFRLLLSREPRHQPPFQQTLLRHCALVKWPIPSLHYCYHKFISQGDMCVLDWQTDEIELSKSPTGSLSQLVIVLLLWGRISMMGPLRSVVIHHVSLCLLNRVVASSLLSFSVCLLICTFAPLLFLRYIYVFALFFTFSDLLPVLLLPTHTLSYWILFLPCRPPLISFEANRRLTPRWAPSGWRKDILSRLNSVQCSDSLRAASECACCSATSWLMFSVTM